MTKNSHSEICRRVVTAIVTASIYSYAGAAPEQPKEMDKVYEFQGKAMKEYGAEIKADILHIESLFGATLDLQRPRQEDTEQQGWLGIAMQLPGQRPQDPDTGEILHAIEVAAVMPASAASVAGLREGDLIVSIDNEPIESNDDNKLLFFRTAITKKHSGEIAKLRVMRNGASRILDVKLKAYPREESVLKSHPELEKNRSGQDSSLLGEALKKGGLTDEYARLVKEFRNETDRVDSLLIHGENYNPFRLREVNYVLYNPLDTPAVARKVTSRLHRAFDKSNHDLEALVATAMEELDMSYISPHADGSTLPTDLSGYTERLLNALKHANEEYNAVLSVFDPGEITSLYETAPKLLARDIDAEKKPKTYAEIRENEVRMLRFFQLVLKLDISRLLAASAEVGHALDIETLRSLDKTIGGLERYPEDWVVRKETNLTVIDTPAGRVLIGGVQDNTYTENAALIIDFGGNDNYLNRAGGNTRRNPFSVVIDLSGNDTYSATEDFAQGAGLLGGGFLIDLEGNDRYTAKSHAQGIGILGVGILADLDGNDQFTAVSASQGVGSFGIGLLAEGGGDDTYFGNYFVQGAGYIKGIGLIVETAGNDNYSAGGMYEDDREPGKAYQSMSQGYGEGLRPLGSVVASGGIGILAEAEGNDTYVADYFGQGSSYWYSLGILDDLKGNDSYVSRRYSQGAGIHMSAGVLLDGEGDDNYSADFGVAQGCGHDFGIGFLLDNGGNDSYVSGVIAQGAGNDSGIGVLSDNGGNDKYDIKSLGQGRGNFNSVRELGSFGFLFDTGGGKDTYSQGGKNGSISIKTQWGISIDTN